MSNRPERFAPESVLFAGERRLVVRSGTPHGGPAPAGRSARGRRWIVGFEGLADRTQAEGLRGAVLTGEPLGPLPEDELWVHELVGAEVVDSEGRALGRVAAVEANPASDLLVLEQGGLVPMVFVLEVEVGRVVVDLPDGLLDL